MPLVNAAGATIPDMSISATITGPASLNGSTPVTFGLTKIDTGTLQLTGNNTYTGPTTVLAEVIGSSGHVVSAGALQVDGTQTASPVTVNGDGIVGGAVLSGTGTLGAVTATNGGTVNPGDPASGVGILTAASLNLTGSGSPTKGGNLQLEINGSTTPGVNFDQIVLSGVLTVDSTSTLTLDLLGLATDVIAPGVPVIVGYSSKTGTLPCPNTILNNPNNFQALLQETATQVDHRVLRGDAPRRLCSEQRPGWRALHLHRRRPGSIQQHGVRLHRYRAIHGFGHQPQALLPAGSFTLASGSGTFIRQLITSGGQTITASDVLSGQPHRQQPINRRYPGPCPNACR